MVIAIDTRGSDAYQQFISNAFTIISSQRTEHRFIFITDEGFDFPSSANTIIEKIKKQSPLVSAIGLDKISSVLKKNNASLLVTCKPFHAKVPVCFIASEKANAKCFFRSKVIIASSEFHKKEISEKYKIDNSKIKVVYRPVNDINQPVNLIEREKVKERFASGNEFFIAKIPGELSKVQTSDLLTVLKAFSKFKKMQKSSMHLLIVSSGIISDDFKKALQLYKFNSEVSLLENQYEAALSTVVASAYAAVYPFNSNDYSHLLQAMQSGVPIIASNITLNLEICGNVAVYFDNTDVSIADNMMLIYKDENLRQQLIEYGRTQIKSFTSQHSADSLWSSIQKATL